MRFRLAIALATALGAIPAAADEAPTTLGLDTGAQLRRHRDELVSPLIYSGFALPIAVAFAHGDLDAAASFTRRALSANGGAGPMELTAVDARVAVRPHLATVAGFDLHAGAALEGSDLDARYAFAERSWDASFALAATASLLRNVGDSRHFRISVTLPLLLWVVRPPYALGGDAALLANGSPLDAITDLGRLGTPATDFAMRAEIAWEQLVTARLGFAIGLDFRYFRHDEPRPAGAVVATLSVGARVRL